VALFVPIDRRNAKIGVGFGIPGRAQNDRVGAGSPSIGRAGFVKRLAGKKIACRKGKIY
jgi:hypothetical protein